MASGDAVMALLTVTEGAVGTCLPTREANINRPGDFNERHDHGSSSASLVASGGLRVREILYLGRGTGLSQLLGSINKSGLVLQSVCVYI